MTGLSRFSYLRVIARSSTERYLGEAVDVRSVGREIGARYVIEGSVRQAGPALRVAVQLVDTVSGAHLWAETYDRPFRPDEVFALQDELVPRIVSTVADMQGVLPRSMSDVVRSRPLEQLSPYEAVLRGFGYPARGTAEELAAARSGAGTGRAEGTDPCRCLGDAGVPVRTGARAWIRTPAGFPGTRARPPHGAPWRRRHPTTWRTSVWPRRCSSEKELESFRIAAERAVALNPMDGLAIAFLGELLAYSGDWERGLALAARAKQLNPHHPGWYWYVDFYDAYRQRDYDGALRFALKVNMPDHWSRPRGSGRHLWTARRWRCGRQGRAGAARAAARFRGYRPRRSARSGGSPSTWST